MSGLLGICSVAMFKSNQDSTPTVSRLIALRKGCSVVGCHNDGSPLCFGVRFVHGGRGVGSDHAANGHEKAAKRSVNDLSYPAGLSKKRKKTPYPNVAPEAPMNWPSVLMIPFGPAPYLKMLTVPTDPTTSQHRNRLLGGLGSCRGQPRTVDEADDDSHSYRRQSESIPRPR